MRGRAHPALFAAALATGVCARADAADKTALAVLELQDKGVGPDLAGNLSDIITAALTKLGVFTVLSRADIEKMIELEASKQMMGCDDAACLAEIGGALGVGLLVSGSIGRVGGELILSLSLTDSREVKVIARETRTIASEDALARETEGATRFLVRELLRGRQGDLIVTTSESGADVEIDGHIVGVTPIAKQVLAGGPHTLKLHKKGFISFAQDVEIESEQPTVVQAAMVPSAEFITAYDSSAFTWRLTAWVAGGLAAGAIGFGVGGYLWNADRANAYERDLSAAGCRATDNPAAGTDCAGFHQRKADIEAFQPAVIGSLAGGAVLAAVSAFFFLQGPEVGAYDDYRAAAGMEIGLGVAPLAHGAALSAWGSY